VFSKDSAMTTTDKQNKTPQHIKTETIQK